MGSLFCCCKYTCLESRRAAEVCRQGWPCSHPPVMPQTRGWVWPWWRRVSPATCGTAVTTGGHCVVVETAQRDGRAEGCPPVSSLSDKGAFLGSFLGTSCVHRTPPAARREGTPGARHGHLCRRTSHLCWDGWAGFSLPSFPPFPSFPLSILISQLGKPHPAILLWHLFPGVVPS